MQSSQEALDGLKAIFSSAPLPALPQSAVQVLDLCQDLEVHPEALAQPIESDAALVLQLLRFLNSSYFGFQGEIRSIQQGLALVGVRTIKNFVLWTAVFSATPDPKCQALEMRGFRRDALRRGIFAKEIGTRLGTRQPDEVFTAALLQDIAVPFLVREFPAEYAELFAARDNGRVRLSELEWNAFGWTHADAACLLFDRWHLPHEFCSLVQHHVDSVFTAQPEQDPGHLAVALSALLPAENDGHWPESESLQLHLEGTAACPIHEIESLLETVDEAFENVAASMKVGTPRRRLLERYLAIHGNTNEIV